MKRLSRMLLPILGAVITIAAWWLVALVIDKSGLPTPKAVAHALVAGFRDHDLLLDLRLSVLRVLIGMAIGCAVAVPVGFLLAWYGILRRTFEGMISFFRAVPPIALIPLAINLFGIGESARLSILTYAAFFTSVVVIYEGVASVDETYVRAARSMGASSFELFRRVVLPVTVPQLFVAVRVALGVCWATLVAAELTAAQRGLGAMIQKSANFFHWPDVYVGIVLIGASALAMDRLIVIAMRRAVRWQTRVVR